MNAPRNRRSPSFVLTFALAALSATGLLSCRGKEAPETLLVAGSTTLVSYLEPVVAAFQKKKPDASIVSEPGGSTAGVVALKRGAIDVAGTARDVGPEEDDIGLRDYLIARDGVAIIVHPSSKVQTLTVNQVAQLFSGEITSWRDLGGDGPVTFISRKKDSRARKSLVDMLYGGDDALRGGREVATGPEMDAAVKADPSAIGFVALKHLQKDARALPINGVPFSRATMLSGRYPLTRSFYLVVFRKPTKMAEDLIAFTLSKDGQALLEEDGLLGVY